MQWRVCNLVTGESGDLVILCQCFMFHCSRLLMASRIFAPYLSFVTCSLLTKYHFRRTQILNVAEGSKSAESPVVPTWSGGDVKMEDYSDTVHSGRRCPARPDGDIRPEAILSTSFGSSCTAIHRHAPPSNLHMSDLNSWLDSTPF